MNGSYILIFDKRIEISNKYKKILEHNKCANVSIVSDKECFFNEIDKKEPDLILISESIEENFANISQEIRNLNIQFRPTIVLLSKSSFPEDKTNALNSGADDFLSEPIDSDEFLARINAHLRRTLEENFNLLTELPNNTYSKKIIRRTIKNSSDWAMLLIGIDNLSFYKEIYGQIAYEKVLQAYSAILKTVAEYDDFIGQIENDNYLVVTSLYKAEKLADYLNYAFDSIVNKFYSKDDSDRGYILISGDNKAEGRISLMNTSIGVINSELINYINEIEVINALYRVQKLAKNITGSSKIIDRPLITSEEEILTNNNIIIIEEDDDLAYLLETSLRIQGFSSIRKNLSDIDENQIINDNPALIIMDNVSENNNSINLCKKIREITNNNIKIIFTDTKRNKEEILSAGADLYLPKPYDLMELFGWIYKLLD